jgi:hypothetical protein
VISQAVETPRTSVMTATLAANETVLNSSSGMRVVHKRLQTAGSAERACIVT